MTLYCKLHQRAVVTAAGAGDNKMNPKLEEGEVVVCMEDDDNVPFVVRESLFLEKGELAMECADDVCPLMCGGDFESQQDMILID